MPLKQKKEKINGTLMLYPESPAVLQVSLKDTETVVSAGEVQYAREHPVKKRGSASKWKNWETQNLSGTVLIFSPTEIFLCL